MKNLFLFFLLANLIGCASVPTRGNLDPIRMPLSNAKKASITFRFYEMYENTAYHSKSIKEDQRLEKLLKISLEKSGLFTEIKSFTRKTYFEARYQDSYDQDFLDTKEVEVRIKDELKISWPIATDYFLDVYSYNLQDSHHSPYMHWGLLHGASLGIIPIRLPVENDFRYTLYNRNGDIVLNGSIIGKYAIWGWTPLFFFNGFHMFRQLTDVQSQNDEILFHHILQKVSGNIK